MISSRGTFPLMHGESINERRTRYEAWLIATREGQNTDPELAAVLSQPNHDPTGATVNFSLVKSIRARCWQCVAGSADAGGIERIRGCGVRKCELWGLRPYQPSTAEQPGTEPAERLSKRRCINQYCRGCMGNGRDANVAQAVHNCSAPTCALFPVRPLVRDTNAPRVDTAPEIQPIYSLFKAGEAVETKT
jgi:hypothetical protein